MNTSNLGELEMMRKESGDLKHTNSEIVRFEKEFMRVIFSACKSAGLRRCDWEGVVNEMLVKFSRGRIEYDGSRGAKATSYYYRIAKNVALDECRKQRLVELDDNEMEHVLDEHEPIVQTEIEDERLIVTEAIRRLVKEMRDKTKVEILIRYVLNKENREDLAEEYGIDNDDVSLVKTRYLPRLKQLLIEILREDEEGKFKIGNFSEIHFLQKYMKNW